MSDREQQRETKVIKRYPNRKLYDTERSQYVNLDELAAMIRDGVDVRVVDHKTGEDVTGMVLAQILYEEERRRQSGVPAEFLKRIIRLGEENLPPWLARWFGATPTHPLQEVAHEVEEQVRRLVERGQLTVDEANRFLQTWLDTTARNIEEWQRRVDDRVVEVFDRVTGIPSVRRQLEELLHRIDMLEKRLDVADDRLRRTTAELERLRALLAARAEQG